MPSISIALCTFNGGSYLVEQLRSLTTQSLLPTEIVICDDGSTDETLSLIKTFAEHTPFPVYIHRNREQLGYRANFMKAARLCRGDLIAFCDQDDVWYNTKIETALESFSSPDVLLVHHRARIIDEAGRPTGATTEESFTTPWDVVRGFTQIFKRELLAFSDYWPQSLDHYDNKERMAHDQWFYFLACSLGRTIFINQLLVDYRQHQSNLYGFSRNRTLFPRPSRKNALRLVAELQSYSSATERRSIILQEILNNSQEEIQIMALARNYVVRYQRFMELLTRRIKAYQSISRASRIIELFSVAIMGGYNSGAWSFGRKAFFKDLFYILAHKSLI